MQKFLKRLNPTSLIYNILGILVALVLWFLSFSPAYPVWQLILTIALTIGNALLASEIAFEAGVTRSRHLLPIQLYLLTTGVLQPFLGIWEIQLAIALVQVSLWLLSTTYRQTFAAEQSFLATLCILAASLFVPDAIILLPALWLCLILQGSFSMRTFLASLIAIIVGALYYGAALYFNWLPWEGWHTLFTRTATAQWQTFIPVLCIYAFALILLIFFLLRYQKEKNSLAAYIFSIGLFVLFAALSCFWIPLHFYSLLGIVACLTASIMTYFVSSQHSAISGIISLLYQLSLIAIFILTVLIK